MSIVLPKRTTKEVIVPIDATATSSTPGTSGTWGAYITMTTTSMNEFVLHGLYYHSVFTEAGTSYSGAIPVQIEIVLGGAGSEVPLVKAGLHYGVQYTHSSSNAQLGAAGLLRVAPVIIPSGSTVRIRSVTSSTHSLFQRFFLAGYQSSQGFPLVLPDDFDFHKKWLRGMMTDVTDASDMSPDGAFTTIVTGTGTWTNYGTTVEMIASAPSGILITDLISSIVDAISTTTTAAVEIGIGGSGSEEWVSLVGMPGAQSMPGPGGGFFPLVRPLWVKQGERVACRAKGTISKTFTIALKYDAFKS